MVLTKCDTLVVEIFTDQGIIGIWPGGVGSGNFSDLIGKNPFDVIFMGLAPRFDVACWDTIGKAKGIPVYQLLATDREPNRGCMYTRGGVMWTYYDRGMGQPLCPMPLSKRHYATRR